MRAGEAAAGPKVGLAVGSRAREIRAHIVTNTAGAHTLVPSGACSPMSVRVPLRG